MKFQKIIAKKNWTIEMNYQRLSIVNKDIANLNREMNCINTQQRTLAFKKKTAQSKIKNKYIYKQQLLNDIKELTSCASQSL